MLYLSSAMLAAAALVSFTRPEAVDGDLHLSLPSITRSQLEPPSIRVWLAGDDVFRYGQSADVYFRADDDAFVTVVRIDTDGRLHLLYPESASRSGRVRGGRTYLASSRGYGSFTANEPAGMGFVFALVSDEPFDFHNVELGDHTHFAGMGRIGGDPFIAIENLADRMLDGGAAYALDYVEYHVGRRNHYPRYANYDCYAVGISIFWSPFSYRCRGYHSIYRDSYYYSRRYYSGRHVVYVREPRRPRYDFKAERSVGTGSKEASVGVREREDNRDYRRPGSPGSDPNIPTRSAESNPGATRPGDDVPNGNDGRRRVIVSDNEERERTGPDARPPRRDHVEQTSPETPRRDENEHRSPETPRRDENEHRSPETPRRDDNEAGTPQTPRRDDRRAEPRSEAAPQREQDRSRRTEPAADRRPSPSVVKRERAKDQKPVERKSTGDSRRRRTP